MTEEELNDVYDTAKGLHWPFPSSYGSPIPRSGHAHQRRAAEERERFAEAVRQLLDKGESERATEIAAQVWRLWVIARDPSAGRSLLRAVLDAPAPTDGAGRARGLAYYGAGLFAARQSDTADSRTRNAAALAIGEDLEDDEVLALAHLGLSRVDFEEGAYRSALEEAQSARSFAASLGLGLAQAPLHLHAQSLRALGRHAEAASLFRESLAHNWELGDEGMIEVELHNLGHVEIQLGNVDAAERCFNRAAEAIQPGDSYGAALKEINVAALALARGDEASARRQLELATQTVRAHALELAPDDQRELDRVRAALRSPDRSS